MPRQLVKLIHSNFIKETFSNLFRVFVRQTKNLFLKKSAEIENWRICQLIFNTFIFYQWRSIRFQISAREGYSNDPRSGVLERFSPKRKLSPWHSIESNWNSTSRSSPSFFCRFCISFKLLWKFRTEFESCRASWIRWSENDNAFDAENDKVVKNSPRAIHFFEQKLK